MICSMFRWLSCSELCVEPVETTARNVSKPALSSSYLPVMGGFDTPRQTRGHSTTESLSQLFSAIAKYLPRDDQTIDLPGALINIGDLCVAEPFLGKELTAVTGRSQNLHHLLRDLRAYIARLHLAHRRLERVRLFVVRHPHRLDHHQPCGLKHDFHLDHVALDGCQLLPRQAIADLDSVFREFLLQEFQRDRKSVV